MTVPISTSATSKPASKSITKPGSPNPSGVRSSSIAATSPTPRPPIAVATTRPPIA